MRKQNLLFWLTLAVVTVGCFKEDDYDLVKGDDLAKVEIDSMKTVEANGVTSSNVKVTISNKAIPSRRSVILKTDKGSFVGGKGDSILLMVDSQFMADAKLTSTEVGKATVTAIIAGLKTQGEGKIEFIKAYPDKITVMVDSFSISNSYKSEVLITAALGSGSGVPSLKQNVFFSVLSPNGQPIGTFLNGNNTAETDASGKATIRYSAGSNSITGILSIIAETHKMDGTAINHTTYLFLTP